MTKKIVQDIEQAILDYVPEKPDKPFVYIGKWVSLWSKKSKYRFYGDPKKDLCMFWDWSDTSKNVVFFEVSASKRKISIPTPEKTQKDVSEDYDSFPETDIITKYMENKGINLTDYRVSKTGTLIIPIYNEQESIISCQFISEKGEKRFKKDCPLGNGFYYPIGNDVGNTIYVCEGVATGATIHKNTGEKVYCALTKGNIDALTNIILNKYRDKQVIMALDNDKDKTHVTKIVNKRLKTVKPQEPGDFNDHKYNLIEKYRLKNPDSGPEETTQSNYIRNKIRFMKKALYAESDHTKRMDHTFLDEYSIIPQSNAILLSGTTEGGKTAFSLNNLKKYLEQGKTVYIWEHSEMNRSNRLNTWMKENKIQHKPIITTNKDTILNAFIKDNIILIDDTDSFFEIKKTIDRREVGDILEYISWIAQLAECTIILCHYMTKTSKGETDIKLRSGGGMTWINKVRYACIIDIGKTGEVKRKVLAPLNEEFVEEEEKPFLTIQKGYRPGKKTISWWLTKDYEIGEAIITSDVDRIVRDSKAGSKGVLTVVNKIVLEGIKANKGKYPVYEYLKTCLECHLEIKRGMAFYYLNKLPGYIIKGEGFQGSRKNYIMKDH